MADDVLRVKNVAHWYFQRWPLGLLLVYRRAEVVEDDAYCVELRELASSSRNSVVQLSGHLNLSLKV